MLRSLHFVLNGRPVTLDTDDQRSLLWVLRTDLAQTGTKYGCGVGICGACTVLAGGKAIRSCRVPLSAVEGLEVVTVEGLARNGVLHPLQQAFIEHGAFQCGYCTSGMLMAAVGLLGQTLHPSKDAIVEHMDHNLCRCGAQQRIVAAIAEVAASEPASKGASS